MIFKFLNHAGFLLETDTSVLVIDPWLEGPAFNYGWDLLDNTTSNQRLIEYLRKRDKNIFIWYSHEHSDHFSISFLKSIKVLDNIKIIYQKTYDNRVKNFLLQNEFEVINPKRGDELIIDNNISISTWPYRGGDSLCLISCCGKTILNINDCEINTFEDSKKVLREINKKYEKIDFLMTQFGYACWNGNENERELRRIAARDKLLAMENQIKVFKPSIILPFASYIYFSNELNFYINDEQNKVDSIKNHRFLGKLKNIFYLKPFDEFNIKDFKKEDILKKSKLAEKHYMNLYKNIKPIRGNISKKFSEESILNISKNYIKQVNKSFPLLFKVKKLELKILISDLNQVLCLDYSKAPIFLSGSSYDIEMNSYSLSFVLNNLFGFNTIHVSGVFKTTNKNSILTAESFFWPQSLLKFGYGINKPIITTLFFIKSKLGFKNELF